MNARELVKNCETKNEALRIKIKKGTLAKVVEGK